MSVNFSCEDFETVSCEPSWNAERECRDDGSQTSHIEFVQSGNQTSSVKDVAVQACKDPPTFVTNVDFDKLAAWLTRITPQLLNELDNVSESGAFCGYKPQESNNDVQIKLMYALDWLHNKPKGFVSSIAWNNNGGVIAVSFCIPKHPNWCDHRGYIALYYVNRQDFKPSVPNRKLELNACITFMSAHPTEPHILACGTFAGEVIVWNFQREEPVVLGSSSLQSESITHIEWVHSQDTVGVKPLLATCSRDGTVFIWNVKITFSSLKLVKSFLLQSEKVDADLGVICAAFHPRSSHQFLAGVDGGSVLLCSTETKRPLPHRREKQDSEVLDLYDPIVATIDGHKGAVTGVLWASSDSDKFLTCGTDSELHIYSVSQLTLVRSIHLAEPCLGMTLCLPLPHLVATWGSSGHVYFLNTLLGKDAISMKSCPSGHPASLSVVCFQAASSFVMACGNVDGQVLVWQVPLDKLLEEPL